MIDLTNVLWSSALTIYTQLASCGNLQAFPFSTASPHQSSLQPEAALTHKNKEGHGISSLCALVVIIIIITDIIGIIYFSDWWVSFRINIDKIQPLLNMKGEKKYLFYCSSCCFMSVFAPARLCKEKNHPHLWASTPSLLSYPVVSPQSCCSKVTAAAVPPGQLQIFHFTYIFFFLSTVTSALIELSYGTVFLPCCSIRDLLWPSHTIVTALKSCNSAVCSLQSRQNMQELLSVSATTWVTVRFRGYG